MGWTWYRATHYTKGTINRKAEIDEILNNDYTKVIKSAMVGSTYYGAIEQLKTQQIFCCVFLTSTCSRDYYNFGYKDMDETCGPAEVKCPKSILKLLTPIDSDVANQWREKCWTYHNNIQQKPALGKLRVGSIVKFTAKETEYQAIKEYTVAHIDAKHNLRKLDTGWRILNWGIKVSSRCINSWGFEIIHSATQEEQENLRQIRLERI